MILGWVYNILFNIRNERKQKIYETIKQKRNKNIDVACFNTVLVRYSFEHILSCNFFRLVSAN